MEKHRMQYINGEFTNPSGENLIETVNPSQTAQVVSSFRSASTEEIEKAIASATEALDGWRKKIPQDRVEYLKRLQTLLGENKEKLAYAISLEMGKSIHEARAEVDASIGMVDYTLNESYHLAGDHRPSTMEGRTTFAKRVPIGVMGLISPWNFPLSTPVLKIAPALLTGNTVVLKPAEDTTYVAELLCELIDDIGLPHGVFNCVVGAGDVGDQIVNHENVHGISFTGSSAVGQKIAKDCGESLKRVALELGGKNPLLIMDDADLDQAIEQLLPAAFGITGQRCTATSKVLVHEDCKERFMEKFLEKVKEIQYGDSLNEENTMGAIVNHKQWERIKEYIDSGIQEGAELVTGGYDQEENRYFIKPTVFTNVTQNMAIARDEIFGPVVSIHTVSSLEEAIQLANDNKYGLTCGLYTRDWYNMEKAIDELESGSVLINSSTIATEPHVPFGGWKKSGNGRYEGGEPGIDAFTEWKTIYID